MPKRSKRIVGILDIKNLNTVPDLVNRGTLVSQCMGNNATMYPNPSPALSVVENLIADLNKAEALVLTRVAGATAQRDVVFNDLFDALQSELYYVQTLADQAASDEEAIALITTAGFIVRAPIVRTKAPLSAKNTLTSGTVQLVAKSLGKRASYIWQWSVDGINWNDIGVTTKASTRVSNLTPATIVKFRVKAIDSKNEGSWSQPISLIVN